MEETTVSDFFALPFYPPQYTPDPTRSTLIKLFLQNANEIPQYKALGCRAFHGSGRGQYQWYSYYEVRDYVAYLYEALRGIVGTESPAYIAILAYNRVEWTILDIACAGLNIITVPLYDTQSVEDCEHVLKLTKVKILFAELDKLLKYQDVIRKFDLKIYAFDDYYSERSWLASRTELPFTLPTAMRFRLHSDTEFDVYEIYKNEKKPSYYPPRDGCADSVPLENVDKGLFGYDIAFSDTKSQQQFLEHNNAKFSKCVAILDMLTGTFSSIIDFRKSVPQIVDVSHGDDEYTLVFTSGTTSEPKAVVLSHYNTIATAETMVKTCLLEGTPYMQDYFISYMPLAHIYMRVLYEVAFFQKGAIGYMSDTAATLLDDIRACAPTALYMVPRVVQKIYDGILARVKKMPAPLRWGFALAQKSRMDSFEQQALEKYMKYESRRPDRRFLDEQFATHYGKKIDITAVLEALTVNQRYKDFLAKFYALNTQYQDFKTLQPAKQDTELHFSRWTNIFFDKIVSLTGGRVRGSVSGSAAIQPHQGMFYRICFNSKLFQGYGASETSAGGTVQTYFSTNYTGIGTTLAPQMKMWLRTSGEYRIDDFPFPRGEIIVAGPSVFKAYLEFPTDPEIIELRKKLGEESLYATGDVGQFNFITGELEIIDRLKNIVKLSYGEFVQLSQIELAVQKHNAVANCYCYTQTYMKFIICVVQVNPEYVKHAYPQLQGSNMTEERFMPFCAEMQVKLAQHCKAKNLKGFYIPKYFVLDMNEWNSENNLLTPAFKVKRGSCAARYGQICDAVYQQLDEGADATSIKILDIAMEYGVALLE